MCPRSFARGLLALCLLLFALGGCVQSGGPEVRVHGMWEVGGGTAKH